MTACTELYIITAQTDGMHNVRAVGAIGDIPGVLMDMAGNAHAEAEISHWTRNAPTPYNNGSDVFLDWHLTERFPWPGSNLGGKA